MANEAVLVIQDSIAYPFTCADGIGIEKGTLLTLSDPRTAAQTIAKEDIIAGIAAVAGTIAAITSISDGIIDPKGGLVVSGEKGTYKLDENDSIVAGTDLNKSKKSTSMSSTSSPQIDLSPLMERINVLIDAVKAGGSVYLDGTKVGTAMAMSTYKTQ
jgi:hypothetical protein